MTCEKSQQVHAYHDEQLPVEQKVALEAHLAACAECRELLEDLKRLTLMFATVPLSDVSPRAINRMYGSFWANKELRDRGVRRLAGWMTAAAAAILVLVPAFSTESASDRDNSTWVDSMAFIAPAGPQGQGESSSDFVQVAQWIANDLSMDQSQ